MILDLQCLEDNETCLCNSPKQVGPKKGNFFVNMLVRENKNESVLLRGRCRERRNKRQMVTCSIDPELEQGRRWGVEAGIACFCLAEFF